MLTLCPNPSWAQCSGFIYTHNLKTTGYLQLYYHTLQTAPTTLDVLLCAESSCALQIDHSLAILDALWNVESMQLCPANKPLSRYFMQSTHESKTHSAYYYTYYTSKQLLYYQPCILLEVQGELLPRFKDGSTHVYKRKEAKGNPHPQPNQAYPGLVERVQQFWKLLDQ